MRRGKLQPLAVIAVFLAVAAFQLWNRHESRARPANPVGRVSSPAPQTPQKESAGEDTRATQSASLSAVDSAERQQVAKTLALIAQGGPFLHRQDGAVFSNREGHLPQKPRGYYREYTVETPNADTRGARRIVRGDGGETYYTNDHYRTFVKIE